MYRSKILLYGLAVLICISCNSTIQHVSDVKSEYHRTSAEYSGPAHPLEDMIRPYRDDLNEEMNVVIGTLPKDLKKTYPNNDLGNWFSDVIHEASLQYNADVSFAIQNNGGLRIPQLSKGDITRGKIYELMPFDNKLVLLTLDHDKLYQLLHHIAEDNGWPVSHGVSLTIADNKATDVTIGQLPTSKDKQYIVAMPDYVANGGGGCGFLKGVEQQDTGVLLRDAVIQYLEKLQQENQDIIIKTEKRIF